MVSTRTLMIQLPGQAVIALYTRAGQAQGLTSPSGGAGATGRWVEWPHGALASPQLPLHTGDFNASLAQWRAGAEHLGCSPWQLLFSKSHVGHWWAPLDNCLCSRHLYGDNCRKSAIIDNWIVHLRTVNSQFEESEFNTHGCYNKVAAGSQISTERRNILGSRQYT